MRVGLDATALSFPPSGVRAYVEALAECLEESQDGVEVVLLQREPSRRVVLPGTAKAGRVLWEAWGISPATRRAGVDLLHVPQFSAPLRSTVPLVVTVHDLIPLHNGAYRRSRGMRAYMGLMSRTVRGARVIIVPSTSVRDDVVRVLGRDPGNVRVIPMAAGEHFGPATDQEPFPDAVRRLGVRQPYVFNVAGFDVRKNVHGLIEAFAHFQQLTGKRHQLVIAGAPHTANQVVYPPVQPLIERLGLQEQVVLPGVVSEAEKVALYQHAAMYVTPSLQEGFGITCLEAMACGLPVIASDRTSLPEVVGDGGLLVEPEPASIAAAMARVAAREDLATELRQRGLARAAQFSWSQTARLTIDAYRNALEPPSDSEARR